MVGLPGAKGEKVSECVGGFGGAQWWVWPGIVLTPFSGQGAPGEFAGHLLGEPVSMQPPHSHACLLPES